MEARMRFKPDIREDDSGTAVGVAGARVGAPAGVPTRFLHDCHRTAARRPQTSGTTQRGLNPGFSERIGNSRRTAPARASLLAYRCDSLWSVRTAGASLLSWMPVTHPYTVRSV